LSEKIRLTFVDITGSKHADVILNAKLTATEIIQKLIDNDFLAKLESGVVYVLQVKGTSKTIQPNQSMDSAGVQNGDILVVGSMTRGGGIQTDLPDDIALKQLEDLNVKISNGNRIGKDDIEKLRQQIDRMELYLNPSIPLIIPEPQDLAVHLVKADLLNIMEDYRSDENKWYSTAWAFIGAILGVIVNWLTAQTFSISIPAIVLIVVFGIVALLSWVSAKNYGKRAKELKSDMLFDYGKTQMNAKKESRQTKAG
jgi:hypothetical protein